MGVALSVPWLAVKVRDNMPKLTPPSHRVGSGTQTQVGRLERASLPTGPCCPVYRIIIYRNIYFIEILMLDAPPHSAKNGLSLLVCALG